MVKVVYQWLCSFSHGNNGVWNGAWNNGDSDTMVRIVSCVVSISHLYGKFPISNFSPYGAQGVYNANTSESCPLFKDINDNKYGNYSEPLYINEHVRLLHKIIICVCEKWKMSVRNSLTKVEQNVLEVSLHACFSLSRFFVIV